MTSAPPGLDVRRVVGTAQRPGDIALGPDHPTVDGLPTIALQVRDGRVERAQWLPGTVHRGAEKLFESRDYRQVLMLVDRHAWLSAFCSEIAVAVAVERALGLVPPRRAQHLRILLCELTRLTHHLAFLAALPGDLPDGWRITAWQWREDLLDLVEQASGHRVHPMLTQAGGLRQDVAPEWVAAAAGAAAAGRATLAALDGATLAGMLDARYAGVAVLDPATARAMGASGPVARASGVDLDLRRDDPCLPYPPFEVPLGTDGDARARVRVLLAELTASLDLVTWAAGEVAGMAGEPVNVRLPKVLRVPEGSSYTWTEGPGGINGYLLVSRNEPTPWRLALRSAGLGNAAALGPALIGTAEADLPAAIASFLLVCGDVDK